MDALWLLTERISHGGGTAFALVHLLWDYRERRRLGMTISLWLRSRYESYSCDIHMMIYEDRVVFVRGPKKALIAFAQVGEQ